MSKVEGLLARAATTTTTTTTAATVPISFSPQVAAVARSFPRAALNSEALPLNLHPRYQTL